MDQEALLPFDNTTPTPPNNINQNITIIEKNNQNTLTFNGNTDCRPILFSFACLFSCSILTVILYIAELDPWPFFLVIFFLFFTVVFCIIWGTSVKKVELIKDEYCNQCTLKITKKCFCSKQYTIMLENSYLLYQEEIMLLIILKTSRDIYFNKSNIQNYPNLITIYERNMYLNRPVNEIQLKIDEFLG